MPEGFKNSSCPLSLRPDLSGKIALVTGASRGIGRTTALELARCGGNVILVGRATGALREVEKEITSVGSSAAVLPGDITDSADIVSLFQEVRRRWGKLDILINNAGIGIFGPLIDFSIEDFDRIMYTNLRGTFLCCREALKLMMASRSGYIINIASMQGIKGYPNQSAYAASKHGIVGLTKSLSAEAQPYGIRVSALLPGGVDTELIRTARPDLDPSELLHPEDVVQAILYLLSVSDRAIVDQIVIRRESAQP